VSVPGKQGPRTLNCRVLDDVDRSVEGSVLLRLFDLMLYNRSIRSMSLWVVWRCCPGRRWSKGVVVDDVVDDVVGRCCPLLNFAYGNLK